MKTKKEVEPVNTKAVELNDKDMEQVLGGVQYYKIQYGETLSDVGQRFDISVAQLCEWNGITNPTKIYAGQRIRVR